MAKEKDDAQFITLTTEQFAQLVGSRQDSDEFLRKQAQYQAEANKKALRPENEQHPAISAFSYPEGDRERPKTPLKCDMYWVGYPIELASVTPAVVDLLNAAEAGEYAFHRTDGSLEKLTVTGERSATGKYTRLEFTFPCRGDFKHNLPSDEAILREAFGIKTAEQDELDQLRAELGRLKAVAVA